MPYEVLTDFDFFKIEKSIYVFLFRMIQSVSLFLSVMKHTEYQYQK